MSNNPYIETNDYNYSGFGTVDLSFDDFEESIKSHSVGNEDAYAIILDELNLDKNMMDKILSDLTKTKNNSFTFIRPSYDCKILFFKDLNDHVISFNIEKIYEACRHNNTQ